MIGLLQGYDLLIVLALVCLLFGASQLPKLARALGSASHEFKQGAQEGAAIEEGTKEAAPANAVVPKEANADQLRR